MKRLIVISATVIFAVILVFGIIAQGPPPQGPPGGPGGGMMTAANMQSALTLNTERSLAYLLLEMNIPDNKLVEVRTAYLKSWKAYKELATKMEAAGTDRDAMMAIRTDAGKINEKRLAELKDILVKADDMKKLNDYETKLNAPRPQRQRQGAGGGGPQGGGQAPGGNMQAPQGQ